MSIFNKKTPSVVKTFNYIVRFKNSTIKVIAKKTDLHADTVRKSLKVLKNKIEVTTKKGNQKIINLRK